MVATRFVVLFAALCLAAYVAAEPEPTPEPSHYCQPCYCHKPFCCASTTTCGALVIPTLATVHAKGHTKAHSPVHHHHSGGQGSFGGNGGAYGGQGGSY